MGGGGIILRDRNVMVRRGATQDEGRVTGCAGVGGLGGLRA